MMCKVAAAMSVLLYLDRCSFLLFHSITAIVRYLLITSMILHVCLYMYMRVLLLSSLNYTAQLLV
jgi:hypothetical protein